MFITLIKHYYSQTFDHFIVDVVVVSVCALTVRGPVISYNRIEWLSVDLLFSLSLIFSMSPSWNQSINSVWCELHPCVSVSQICSQLSERLEKQQTLNKGELEKIRVRLSHAQTAFIQTAHLVSLAVHVGTNSSRSNNFFKTFATNLKKYLPKNLNSFIMWRPVFYLPLLDYWKKLQKRCKGAKICHKTGP